MERPRTTALGLALLSLVLAMVVPEARSAPAEAASRASSVQAAQSQKERLPAPPTGPTISSVNPASAQDIVTAIAPDPSIVTGASFVAVPPVNDPNGVGDSPLTRFPTDGGTFGVLTTGAPTWLQYRERS